MVQTNPTKTEKPESASAIEKTPTKTKTEKPYYPSLLLYGTLGTGKTAFYGQSGELLLDFDDGARTLKSMADKWTEFRLRTWNSKQDLYEPDHLRPTTFSLFRNIIYNLKKLSRKSPETFPLAVGIDSFTGLVKAGMMSIQANSGNQGKNPQIQEWGILFNEIEILLRIFRSLPCVKVLLAHEQFVEDAAGNTRIHMLCPGKKFPLEVAGFFDDVMYAKVKSIGQGKHQYILTVTSTAAVACRTRTAFTGDWSMDDGFWPLIKELGYEKPKTKPETAQKGGKLDTESTTD